VQTLEREPERQEDDERPPAEAQVTALAAPDVQQRLWVVTLQ
jgi:hypothetical protein